MSFVCIEKYVCVDLYVPYDFCGQKLYVKFAKKSKYYINLQLLKMYVKIVKLSKNYVNSCN